jgi:general secretion pathway protein G
MSFIITGKDKDGKGYTTFSGIHVSLLFLALIIIGILAAMIVPKCTGKFSYSKKYAAKADIGTISQILENYKIDNGIFPTTEQGLQSLLEKPSPSPPNWKGSYLKSSPIDPWLRVYRYRCPNQQGFYLWSAGPDGKDETDDDITNWEKDKSIYYRRAKILGVFILGLVFCLVFIILIKYSRTNSGMKKSG